MTVVDGKCVDAGLQKNGILPNLKAMLPLPRRIACQGGGRKRFQAFRLRLLLPRERFRELFFFFFY